MTDLFNNPNEVFRCALETFGVWPMTVWPVNMSDPKIKQLKAAIGDTGQARGDTGEKVFFAGSWREVGSSGFYTSKGFGAFNPAIASWLLNCYAPKTGVCFDPFAGGGTRAILAASNGLHYLGTEIRQDEVSAINDRCMKAGVSNMVDIYCVDARLCSPFIGTDSADYLLTCPPYYDMEKYQGGAADLSMCDTYADFLDGIEDVIIQTKRVLKSGAVSNWVVGLHRDKKGGLLAMNHDIARLHTKHGFMFKEEIVLSMQNNGAIQRVGNFSKGNGYLIRSHEYALVFIND